MANFYRSLRRIVKLKWVQAAYLKTLLPLLRLQPIPSTVLGPVKGYHSSLSSWIEKHNDSHWLRDLRPASLIYNTRPVLAVPRIPQGLAKNIEHKIPRIYLAHIFKGRIATQLFDVISPDDRIFADLYFTGLENILISPSQFLPWLPRLEEKSGTFATIATGRRNNYYHWINDCLTRLWVLEACGITDYSLIIPDKLLPFQRETLEMLGYTGERLIPFGNEHWRVEHLLVPSLVNSNTQSCPEACFWVREKILAALLPARRPLPERIYVSRANATKRRLINEAEVIRMLRRYGFTSVCTEGLTVQEQVQLFHHAHLVVAPHGAGLANQLFMRPGSITIELFHYRRAKPTSFSMANAVGVKYCCITDAPEQPEAECSGWSADIDFSIPVSRIALALRELGIS